MIILVGAGGMGSVIARSLSSRHEVAVLDRNPEVLKKFEDLETYSGNPLDYPEIGEAELIVTALPSEVAPGVVNALIRRGRNIVDISFTDYDPFSLDQLAKSNNSIFVPHAGFAPGLSNILAGRLYYREGARNIEILVGGLQEKPIPPMLYVPTFNASSVIDEYTRPARYLQNGHKSTVEPLETVERVFIKDIGDLESFYSDGLATILDTLQGATVIEKTLRYPGHLEKMKFLRDMGYFSSEKLGACSPREISDEIFRNMVGDYHDLSYLEVRSLDASGTVMKCLDHYDPVEGISSMARMTGYSASAIAEGVLQGLVESTGVFATEWIGKNDAFFDMVIRELENHSIRIGVGQEEAKSE